MKLNVLYSQTLVLASEQDHFDLDADHSNGRSVVARAADIVSAFPIRQDAVVSGSVAKVPCEDF